MFSEIFLRLEPLGLELVAAGARAAGHDVKVLDLQVFKQADYFRIVNDWKPNAIGFSLNYLANIPEVLDLAKATAPKLPACFIFAGGHSASFTAKARQPTSSPKSGTFARKRSCWAFGSPIFVWRGSCVGRFHCPCSSPRWRPP